MSHFHVSNITPKAIGKIFYPQHQYEPEDKIISGSCNSAAPTVSSPVNKLASLQLANKILFVERESFDKDTKYKLVDLKDFFSLYLGSSYVLYKVSSLHVEPALKSPESTYMVIADNKGGHKDIDEARRTILDLYKLKEHEVDPDSIYLQQQGGGSLLIYKNAKEIHIAGISGTFGKANHKLVAEIIKSQFPDFKVFYPVELT